MALSNALDFKDKHTENLGFLSVPEEKVVFSFRTDSWDFSLRRANKMDSSMKSGTADGLRELEEFITS